MSTETQVQLHTIREVNEFLCKDEKKRIVRFGGGAGARNNTPTTPTNAQGQINFNFVNNNSTTSTAAPTPSIAASFQTNNGYDFSSLDGISLHRVCAGAVHYLILTANNELYSVGKNSMGQIGVSDIPLYGETRFPTQVKWPKLFNDEYIVDISAKGWHSMILTSYGRVLVFGSNRYGQLGVSPLPTHQQAPQDCVTTPTPTYFKLANGITTEGAPYMKKIKFISAGVNHSLCATEDGFLFSAGWGEKGQTGHNSNENVFVFTEIANTRKMGIYSINQISCGGEHSMCLTDDSKLFIFGKYKKKNYNTPTQVILESPTSYSLTDFLFYSSKRKTPTSTIPQISQISSGDFFALVLTKDGKVFSFGDNDKGQCAQPAKFTHIEKPKQIPFFTPEMKIKTIIAGSSHAFAISETGTVFAFGRGEGERLALFDGEKNHYEPQHVQCLDGFGTKKIAASGMFTLICNSESPLEYVWNDKSKYLKQLTGRLKTSLENALFSDMDFFFSD